MVSSRKPGPHCYTSANVPPSLYIDLSVLSFFPVISSRRGANTVTTPAQPLVGFHLTVAQAAHRAWVQGSKQPNQGSTGRLAAGVSLSDRSQLPIRASYSPPTPIGLVRGFSEGLTSPANTNLTCARAMTAFRMVVIAGAMRSGDARLSRS